MPSKALFGIAAGISISSTLVAFSSVCAFLLDQAAGCGDPDVVETHIWFTYACLSVFSGVMTGLYTALSLDGNYAETYTIMITKGLSILTLAGLSVFAGLVAGAADEKCSGEDRDGLLGTSIAASAGAAVGAALLLLHPMLCNGNNDGTGARYRRARRSFA